jgi:dethiobiotin synthetase
LSTLKTAPVRVDSSDDRMSAYFVTATGTDIGKTFVTAGLVRHLREIGAKVSALKPVASGFDIATAATSDAGVLLEALDIPITPESLERISPWRFAAPLSPDMAAALRLPLIVVAGSYLGTISHTLTALDVVGRRDLRVAALVVNDSGDGAVPLDETIATLKRFTLVPIAIIPRVKTWIDARVDF